MSSIPNPSGRLQADRAQIAQQLKLLGYAPNEKVFLRAFYPSNDPRKSAHNDEATTVELIAQAAEKYQNEGKGIYLVVNGQGQKDSDVKTCRAVFFEHDNLDKKLQLILWRKLGLPEPTFQIDTGGKSIHSYWVFDKPIDPQHWKSLQTDLLEFADADRSLKNPSRVMRLAGCYHISSKGACPTTIVSASGTRYPFEEIRQVVPAPKKATTQPATMPLSFENVPLENCLRREDRDLILHGVIEGGRNTTGAMLARNLIGTALRLPYLGYAFSGDPRQLFDDYCSRCSPPLDAKEADQIWKSAENSNPIATLTDAAIENCVKAWRKNQQIPSVEQPPIRSVNGGVDARIAELPLHDRTKSGEHKVIQFPRQILDTNSLLNDIESLISKGGTRAQIRGELLRLAKLYEIAPGEVEKLYGDRKSDEDQDEDKADLAAKLPSLIESQNARLNLGDFLWGDGGVLAESMRTVATEMPTAPEFLFTSFLPVVASRLGTAAQIVVKPSAGFRQPSIVRICLVAKSGDLKSPAQKIVIHPLEELENEAREAYAEEMKLYEEAIAEWKKNEEGAKPTEPVCKRYLLQGGSIESKIAIHKENPRGLLIYRDEWSAHLSGRNKYRQGKGDDAEQELSEFDGGQLIKDVTDASKRLHLAKTAISRCGTTQFSKLKELMGQHDDCTGEFARWLFCVAPSPRCYIDLDSEKPLTLTKLLKDLYRNLELLPPQEYFLSDAAKGFYQKYHNSLVDLGYEEQNPGIQIALPKIRSYFARLTLVLHCVNQVLAGSVTDVATHIDAFTVEAASQLCDYFLAQLHVVHALNNPHQELEGRVLYLKTWFQGKQEVTARQILRTLSQYKKASKEELESDLQILLEAGYIIQEKKGKAVSYSSVAASVADNKKAESTTGNGLDNPFNIEVSPTVAASVADLNPDTVNLSADFDPKCHRFFNFPSSDPSNLEIVLPATNGNESEKTKNSFTDGDSSDTLGLSLTEQTIEVGDTCEKVGDTSDTSSEKTENSFTDSDSSDTWGLSLTEQPLEVGDTSEKVGDSSDTSLLDETDNQFSPEEVEVNAGFIRDAIAEANWKMIAELTDGWQAPFKKAVWGQLDEAEREVVKAMVPSQPELEKKPEPQPETQPESKKVSDGWKNCVVKNLKVGDRISCYPTFTHVQRPKDVTAIVVGLEVDNTHPEYLTQVEVEYTEYRKGGSSRKKASICGASVQDWILGRAK